MTTVEGAVDDTTMATTSRSADVGARLRSWLDEPRQSIASMSSGQRYTAVLALALAVAMVTIGVPEERATDTSGFGASTESAVTYEPGVAPPTTMAPPAAMPSFAEPPAFAEPATATTMAPAPAYESTPPPSEPPPSSTTTTTAPPAAPLPVPVPVFP